MAISLTNAAAIAACDAVVDLVDAGTTDANGDLVIYDGTPPADADTALSGNTVLARVELQNPAWGAAADAAPGGQSTLQGTPLSDNSIDATGTASFFRMFDRDNGTVLQGTVTATGGGGDIEVNSLAFQISATFTITSGTITMPES